MKFQATLVKAPTVSESDLGKIARFTHTPIGTYLSDDDPDDYTRIAVNCFKRRHMSVLEFADLLYDVQCPIFVARQLMRHRNGTFMEKSLRYLKAPNLYDSPKDDPIDPFNDYRGFYVDAVKMYNILIEAGERKEMARAVLPLCTPTEFLWRISLRSLLNVFEQRLAPTAQKETRAVVQQMFDLAEPYYPGILGEWKNEWTAKEQAARRS